MKPDIVIALPTLLAGLVAGCATSAPGPMKAEMEKEAAESYYLPNAAASRVVSVTTNGPIRASILVQTHAVAVKETGPRETVARFGEVYAFSPAFIAVHREEPTQIRFWNLQADDDHDFMLVDPHGKVLMKVLLPPLQETSFVFTFHEEGLFDFLCAMHQPAMSGQILVLPPMGRDSVEPLSESGHSLGERPREPKLDRKKAARVSPHRL